MTNRTSVHVATPSWVDDEPWVYLNEQASDGVPFSVVTLAPHLWLYLREPGHARAIAAAFTKAADLLDDAAQRQAGGQS